MGAQIQLLDLEVQNAIKVLTPFQSGAGKFSGKIKNCIRVLGESDLGLSGKAKLFYDDCKNFIVTRNNPKIVGNLRRKQCQVIKTVLEKNPNVVLTPEQDAVLPWCKQVENQDKNIDDLRSVETRTSEHETVVDEVSVQEQIYKEVDDPGMENFIKRVQNVRQLVI